MQLLNIINNCFEYSLSEKNINIEQTLTRILTELCTFIGAKSGFIAEKWTDTEGEPYLKYYALYNIKLSSEDNAFRDINGFVLNTCFDIKFSEDNKENYFIEDLNIFPLLSKKYPHHNQHTSSSTMFYNQQEVIGLLGLIPGDDYIKLIEPFTKFISNIITNIRGIQELENHKLGFIANMSHEVRTPLNGIISMVDILAKTELNPIQQSYIEIIKNCNIQMLDIVNDVLDYSKIITNGMKLKLAPVHLYKTISIVNSMLYQKAADKGLLISLDINNDVPEMIIADSTRLKQVLINIISNSIKFTKKGGININISMKEINDVDCILEFIIEDTGIGIPENKISKIFDSFRQIDNDYLSDICGVGLGLPITKHIIELHSGGIDVTSKLNIGTKIIFTMKFLLFNDYIDKTKLTAFYTNKNVLIIDSDHGERACIFSMLSEIGIKPIMAVCISDALIYLSNAAFSFEFIIININSISTEEMHKINHMKNQTIKIIIVDMESIENNNITYDYKLVRPIDSGKLNYLLNIIYVSNQYFCKNNQNEIMINGTVSKLNELNIKNTTGKLGINILIAEDNKQNQQVLVNILNHIKASMEDIVFNIILADDGKEALHDLLTMGIDVAFIDLKMPGIDGISLCQQYKKEKQSSCICIAVTASMSDDVKHKCFKSGMNGFVSKPIDMTSIETILKLVINKKTYI